MLLIRIFRDFFPVLGLFLTLKTKSEIIILSCEIQQSNILQRLICGTSGSHYNVTDQVDHEFDSASKYIQNFYQINKHHDVLMLVSS